MNDTQPQPPTVIPGDGPGAEYVSRRGIWIILIIFCIVALGLLGSLVVLWPGPDSTPAPTSVAVVQPPATEKPPTDTSSRQTTDIQTTDLTSSDLTKPTHTDKSKPGTPTFPSTGKPTGAGFKITSISPAFDDPKGGTLALISGSDFPNTVTVRFGEAQATEVAVVCKELIRVKVPAHAAGVVDVTVKGDSETTDLAQGFAYRDSLSQRSILLLVLLAGALGGTLYSLISLPWYVGNRELKWSWVPSYLARPFTAAALAGIFFLILATGVWTGVTGTGQLWIVGFAALVGLFSKEGYQRLKMIFEALFAPAPKGADSVKTAPAGTLVIDKSSGQQGDIVQITGSGFTAATTVRFDAAAAAVIVKSPTVLSVTVPPHVPGQVDVTVTNPGNPPEIHTLKFTYV